MSSSRILQSTISLSSGNRIDHFRCINIMYDECRYANGRGTFQCSCTVEIVSNSLYDSVFAVGLHKPFFGGVLLQSILYPIVSFVVRRLIGLLNGSCFATLLSFNYHAREVCEAGIYATELISAHKNSKHYIRRSCCAKMSPSSLTLNRYFRQFLGTKF